MLVALNSLVREGLRRAAVLAAVVALAAAVVGAHGALTQHHGDDHSTTAAVVVVCLAVAAPTIACGAAALGVRMRWARLPAVVSPPALEGSVLPERPPPRARPALLQVFLR